MGDESGSALKWTRRLFGAPRIRTGVLWFCFGLVLIVIGLLDHASGWRFVAGAAWMALGAITGVIALRDRTSGRGFYARASARRDVDTGERG